MCGKEVATGADSCSFCGALLPSYLPQHISSASVHHPDSISSIVNQSSMLETKPHSKAVIIGYIFALLGGFIGIFIGYWLRTEQHPSDKKHGKTILVLSVIMTVVWGGLYIASS
jgi:hypothetical protein